MKVVTVNTMRPYTEMKVVTVNTLRVHNKDIVGLVLRREIIAVCFEIHIQHVYNVRLLILMKGGGTV
jgi:hypothetical protein